MGNLTIGVVTDVHLKELFNGALSHLVPDPLANPPVVSAQLDPSGTIQRRRGATDGEALITCMHSKTTPLV